MIEPEHFDFQIITDFIYEIYFQKRFTAYKIEYYRFLGMSFSWARM